MRRSLLALASFLGVTLLAEGVVRVGSTLFQDINRISENVSEDWFDFSPDVGWKWKENYEGHMSGAERHFGRAGYLAIDTAQVADTVKPKVLFIGDSNTFGYSVDSDSSFPQVVERLLPYVNAINLGVNGYTSYQCRVSFEKHAAELKPAIAVVSFGFNDRRYVLSQDEVDGDMRFTRLYEQSHVRFLQPVLAFLENSYLYRALREVLRKVNVLPPTPSEVRVDRLYPRVDTSNYRRNLVGIAEEARRRKIGLVFVLLKDNPIESSQLRMGVQYLAESRYDLAISYLKAAVEMRNWFTDIARIYLARAYEMNGLYDKATEVRTSKSIFVSLHGGRILHLDEEYNAIMREVAAKYSIELVDAGQLLDEGPSLFSDFCHFNSTGHWKLGTLIAERIARMLGHSSPRFVPARHSFHP